MNFFKKLFEWGFMKNTWAWFHIMFGGIGARVFVEIIDPYNAFWLVVLITILWEVFEFINAGGTQGVIKIYGSVERWLYDCAGDILGANLMAFLVIF